MILVDTSVWIDHFRRTSARLTELLEQGEVQVHPFVVGELACGNLRQRAAILDLLQRLPTAVVASDGEALTFVERHRLMGRGIGYIDVHLLASTFLTSDTRLWTSDARLATAASRLFIGYDVR